MLAIIRLALRRPYTFVVLAILILLIGPLAILRTPTDIFPDIKLPVIGVVWNYNGLAAGRDVRPHHHVFRTADDDDGQRYRAHRVAVTRPASA
jgi:hypothetical protein